MIERKAFLFSYDSVSCLDLLLHPNVLNNQVCILLLERLVCECFDLRVVGFGQKEELVDQSELKKFSLTIFFVPC